MDAAVLMADLAGFTAMTEVHGDDLAADVGAGLLATAVHATDSRLLTKGLGDGVLAIDRDPACLARDALALQHRIATTPRLPALRVALHHGAVVERAGDYYGRAINLVSRLADALAPGQVVATADFLDAMGPVAGLRVGGAERVTLRDVEEPVVVHVLHRSDRGRATVIDPVCRMALDPDAADVVVRRDGRGQRVHFCSTTCADQYAPSD